MFFVVVVVVVFVFQFVCFFVLNAFSRHGFSDKEPSITKLHLTSVYLRLIATIAKWLH